MDSIDDGPLPRNDDGTLPAYAGPGRYQIRYLLEDGETLCAPCANGAKGSDAREGASDAHWNIQAAFVNWEGPLDFCAYCNAEMTSEYGAPEAEA